MKTDFIQEPELEFGAGRHIDIRFGLMTHGPLDVSDPMAPRSIRIGLVGTPETLEGLVPWLEKCKSEIPRKQSPRPNLFPKFPGFNLHGPFQAEIIFGSRSQRQISTTKIADILKIRDDSALVSSATDLFLAAMKSLAEDGSIDVFVCAPPYQLDRFMHTGDEPQDGQDSTERQLQDNVPSFHDLLKAKAMHIGKPIQLVFPGTYLGSVPRRQRLGWRTLQDEATRAWNLHTALYYKAGGKPWRLLRDPTSLTTCFVGVSFYESSDYSGIQTSVAQIFNERGEGIIVRGAQATKSSQDRQLHLKGSDAEELLSGALRRYREEHHTLPARVVLHKTSSFSDQEIEGFSSAIKEYRVDSLDMLHLSSSSFRAFRVGYYPPLRGTLVITEKGPHYIWTRGSVDFYSAYPGLYVPRPIQFDIETSSQTPKFLAQEILSLTKMNWNSTQFDNRDPITTRAARQVGSILKHMEPTLAIQHRYSFYM